MRASLSSPLTVAIVLGLELAVRAQSPGWIAAPSIQLPDGAHETHALAAGDVDGDGDVDLVLGNVGQTVLWRNDEGRYVDVTSDCLPRVSVETNALALADFDGDDDLDLFLGNGGWFGGRNCLWLNDGRGRFLDATDGIDNDYTWTNDVAAGDVDGDGDLDLLLAKFNHCGLLLNTGDGHLREVGSERLPASVTAAMAVVLGDVDGDGDLDAVLGAALYEPNRLWLNDGGGRFEDATEGHLPADRDDTLALALGDVDGDGDPDLVLGNANGHEGARNATWLNDGRGLFRPARAITEPAATDCTTSLLLVDLDRDGTPELVVGNGRENGARSAVLRRPWGLGGHRWRPLRLLGVLPALRNALPR